MPNDNFNHSVKHCINNSTDINLKFKKMPTDNGLSLPYRSCNDRPSGNMAYLTCGLVTISSRRSQCIPEGRAGEAYLTQLWSSGQITKDILVYQDNSFVIHNITANHEHWETGECQKLS